MWNSWSQNLQAYTKFEAKLETTILAFTEAPMFLPAERANFLAAMQFLPLSGNYLLSP